MKERERRMKGTEEGGKRQRKEERERESRTEREVELKEYGGKGERRRKE